MKKKLAIMLALLFVFNVIEEFSVKLGGQLYFSYIKNNESASTETAKLKLTLFTFEIEAKININKFEELLEIIKKIYEWFTDSIP